MLPHYNWAFKKDLLIPIGSIEQIIAIFECAVGSNLHFMAFQIEPKYSEILVVTRHFRVLKDSPS